MCIVSNPLYSLPPSLPPPLTATLDTDSLSPLSLFSFCPLLALADDDRLRGWIFRGWYSQTEPRLAQRPHVG
jgi:hypothetical protein